MARTGQWQGEGAGNLNAARSGRGQWRCARGTAAGARRLWWRCPARGGGGSRGGGRPGEGQRGSVGRGWAPSAVRQALQGGTPCGTCRVSAVAGRWLEWGWHVLEGAAWSG